MHAVDCDHSDRGAGMIGFITERSSSSGTPGSSSWANPIVATERFGPVLGKRLVANPIAHPEDGYWTNALVGDRGPGPWFSPTSG